MPGAGGNEAAISIIQLRRRRTFLAMPVTSLRAKHLTVLCLIAFFVVAVKTTLQLHYGFNLADESFLWYGMQRVLHGEVPIRDFMAYDPARYYYGGAAMFLMRSDGIIAMRLADAFFEFISLWLALILIARHTKKSHWLYIFASAAALCLWMMPLFKVFDHGTSIGLICSLAYLMDHPTRRRYLFAGVVLGIAAMFGRNHLLYGVLGTGLAVLYINLRERHVPIPRAFVSWFSGVLLGYSPTILMMLFVPGFAAASWDMVKVIAQNGTNLPLPVPWPWTYERGLNQPWDTVVSNWLIGWFFVLFLVFGFGALIYIFVKRWKGKAVRAELAACAVLTLPYAHYAFSRAEVNHVSFGGFPLFIGLLLASRRFGLYAQTAFAVVFAVMAYVIVLPQAPGRWDRVPVTVSNANLTVSPYVANDVQTMNKVVAEYAPNGQSYLVSPFWPGAYPMFDRRSPIWDLYTLVPREEERQRKEIEDIQNANIAFALIVDTPPGGDRTLLFSHTNPLIWKYLKANYNEVQEGFPEKQLHLFLPRSANK